MQKFYKGRTNNHLTWVMVDATDFATPESAMSAATKIKIYGKLRGATGVNFVSSGTGSLTNDIVHVGASVLGIYTIALAKADLSDASAAWYDQYIISLSATGAAYQTLVVDGGIDDSTAMSRALLTQSTASDAASAAAQANSRVLLVQSIASDVQSAVLVVQSMASDAASAAIQANSRVLLNQSRISDVYSMLSDMQSDFQSRVPKAVATNSQLSDLHSDIRSYLVVMSGVLSDAYSALSDFQSDFQSRVPKRVATDSQLSDLASDVKSAVAIGNSRVLVVQSMASDAASAAQQANSRVVIGNSRVLLAQSMASDAASAAAQANSRALVIQSQASDVYSATIVVDDFVDSLESRLTSATAAKLAAHALSVLTMVADVGCTTTSIVFKTVNGSTPSATDDFYKNAVIVFTSGTQAGERCAITAYNGTTKAATVSALTSAPANNDTAVIV